MKYVKQQALVSKLMLLRQVEVIRRGIKLWCLSEVLKFQLKRIRTHTEYTIT